MGKQPCSPVQRLRWESSQHVLLQPSHPQPPVLLGTITEGSAVRARVMRALLLTRVARSPSWPEAAIETAVLLFLVYDYPAIVSVVIAGASVVLALDAMGVEP